MGEEDERLFQMAFKQMAARGVIVPSGEIRGGEPVYRAVTEADGWTKEEIEMA
jgi:hypothetical protein